MPEIYSYAAFGCRLGGKDGVSYFGVDHRRHGRCSFGRRFVPPVFLPWFVMTPEDRAWFVLRAQIASCLWAAMAAAERTPEDVAAALGMAPRRIRRILYADKAGCSTAELAVIAHQLGFRWVVNLSKSPESEAEEEARPGFARGGDDPPPGRCPTGV